MKSLRAGFTLIEMLVVLAIIMILLGASIGSYAHVTRAAEKAKAQELVSNVATALTTMYQQEGSWPKRIVSQGATDGKLDAETALCLVKGTTKYFSLSVNDEKTALTGADKFGIVTPWATRTIKRLGTKASTSSRVGDTSYTIDDHILHFAVDQDGDGIIKGASVGGKSVDVRATAIVWCCGKDGVMAPYPYGSGGSGSKGANSSNAAGHRSDDVYSWTPGQTQNVQ